MLDARGENVLGKLGEEEGRGGGGGEMLPTLGRGRGGGDLERFFSLSDMHLSKKNMSTLGKLERP